MSKIAVADILDRFKKIELSSVPLNVDHTLIQGLFSQTSL